MLARWRDIAFCLLISALLIVMQYRSGAFAADLAADNDEPAHAVSSLMVHDYLVQGLPHNPLTFARMFYAHYSKVAIGHWPPLFYCAEGLWMLLLGRNRAALLLFVALCGAALACSIFFMVRRRSSTPAALMSLAILMSPLVFHQILQGVRSDLLLALLIFWAAVHCGEYMHSRSRRNFVLFWLFTIAALLVHGRAGVLLFVPFFLLPIYPARNKWRWWIAGVLLLAASQIPHFFRMSDHFSVLVVLSDARRSLASLVFVSSWLVVALALLGLRFVLRDGPERQFWGAMAGLAVGGFVFSVAVPVPWDDRYSVPTFVAIAVLAGGGVQAVLNRISASRPMLRRATYGIVAAAALAWTVAVVVHVEKKPDPGYRNMIAGCLLCGHEVGLVAGDARHEGALIAEASLSDPGRTHTVLRASKVLSQSSWSGYGYRPQFSSPSQVLAYLDQANVSVVVIQNQYSRTDVDQLRSALGASDGDWVLMNGAFPAEGVTIFRRPASHFIGGR